MSSTTHCIAIALLAFAAASTAQDTAPPKATQAPNWVLKHFDVSAATTQSINTPTGRKAFSFQVLLGTKLVTVNLEPNDVRAASFKLLVDDGTTLHELPRPASVTWRGDVSGHPSATAAASIINGSLKAIVSFGQNTPLWSIESLNQVDPQQPRNSYAVFSAAESTLTGITCGVNTTGHKPHQGTQGPAGAVSVAEIAIDCDLDFYQRNGSNSTTTQNKVTTIMNGVAAIYIRDVNIDYVITTVIIRTVATYTTTDMRQLLPQFRTRWQSSHGGVKRDVAHLFTGKGSFSGIVGIAYVGVICGSSSYGCDKAFSSSMGTNVGLVCHELGHNWNAPHCSGSSCNIMCASLSGGGCAGVLSSFGPSTISVISSFRNSRSCLDTGKPGHFTVFGQGCVGTGQKPAFCATLNPNGGGLTGLTRTNEYAYTVNNSQALQVLDFEIFTQTTTGGNLAVNAYIYADSNGQPANSPLATGIMKIGSTAGFYKATFAAPVNVNGKFYISLDHSAQNTVLSNLSSGSPGGGYYRRTPVTGSWSASGIIRIPSYKVNCVGGGGGNAVPQIGSNGVAEISRSFDVTLDQAAPSHPAVMILGISNQSWLGGSLPFSLTGIGAPGCSLLVSTEDTVGATTNAVGQANVPLAVPNVAALVGLMLHHQWFVLDNGANAIGIAVSAGAISTIGG